MKPEDLKIGNYVNHVITDDEYNEIKSIDDEGNVSVGTITSFQPIIEEIQPIEITKEWLVRLGFKAVPVGYMIGNLIFKPIKSNSLRLVLNINDTERVVIDYVHELQNLYYSITNKELKIK